MYSPDLVLQAAWWPSLIIMFLIDYFGNCWAYPRIFVICYQQSASRYIRSLLNFFFFTSVFLFLDSNCNVPQTGFPFKIQQLHINQIRCVRACQFMMMIIHAHIRADGNESSNKAEDSKNVTETPFAWNVALRSTDIISCNVLEGMLWLCCVTISTVPHAVSNVLALYGFLLQCR